MLLTSTATTQWNKQEMRKRKGNFRFWIVLLFVMVVVISFLKGISLQKNYYLPQEQEEANLLDSNLPVKSPRGKNKRREGHHHKEKRKAKNDIVKNNTATEPITKKPKKSWWQKRIEEVSVVYKPTNNTDWCVIDISAGNKNDGRIRQSDATRTTTTMTATKHARQHVQMEQSLPKTAMYLVKTQKAASSTAAAVALQIAETVGEQKFGHKQASCPHHVHHGNAYLERQEPNFLWTIVREPGKRSIADYFFFEVSRHNTVYSSNHLLNHLTRQRHFQIKSIGLLPQTNRTLYEPRMASSDQLAEMVGGILQTYNFIAVAERMDESLVVMKLLFGFITDETTIVLSSKRAGGYDDGSGDDGRCHKIQKAYTTSDVDEYVAGGFQRGNIDYLLYAAVNRSLDRTIDILGRQRVEEEVKRHQTLQELAESRCAEETIFPCTQENVEPNPQSQSNCYFGDVGCGHECVKRVIREYLQNHGTTGDGFAR